MHTVKIQKSTSSNAHVAKPFFNKSGTGSFFAQPKESQKPFFNSSLVQAKTSNQEANNKSSDKPRNSNSLPDPLKSGLEGISGMDLSGVRVHKNSSKPAQLNALAYAQGQDIHLSPGQEKHLPHEGWHTVQQMQGRVKPTTQTKGVSINDNSGLEREADVMGAKALQKKASNKGDSALRSWSFGTSKHDSPIQRETLNNRIPGMPDIDEVAKREEVALGRLGGNVDSKIKIDGGENQEGKIQSSNFEVTTTASGSKGSITTTTTIQLIYDPGDPTTTVLQNSKYLNPEEELGTPKDVPAYPIRILYNRIIKYTDSDGRTVDLNMSGNVHFTHETWSKQVHGTAPTFENLQQMRGDFGVIRVYLIGKGPIPKFAYYARYVAQGLSLSFQTGYAQSMLPFGAGILGFHSAEPASFLDLDLPGGEQFESLRAFLISADALELARRLEKAKEKEKSGVTGTLVKGGKSSWLGRLLSSFGNSISDLWGSLPAPVRGVLSALAKAGLAIGAILGLAAVIVLLSPVELAIGTVALVLGGIMLAAGFVSSLFSRSKEAEITGKGSTIGVIFTALLDAVGISMIIESITDNSLLSGTDLNRTEEERWEQGTLGAIQTIATFFGIRAAFKRTPLYGKTTEAADSSLAAGEGGTDALGNIKYSPHGSASEQALVLSHERVHSFFSPRFKPLRNFRARKGMSAYEKSSLLRYAEEAMAETYAQWRVNGLKGIPEGIRFPISEGYVYITKAGSAPGFTATGGRLGGIGLVQEVFIGTIVIGGITYSAYVIADQVFNDKDNAHQADPETVGAAP